ncbi:MAG: hypothetical protein K8F60_17110 [Melioribacteraceae bacterium]|nr:hypothetical protein [Melioribacteraceae bacterium]
MIRKLFLFIIIGSAIIAQDQNKGQDIELPDFVITGIQSVDIPTMAKRKIDLIPVLSNEFFNPVFSPEELEMSKDSNPITRNVDILSSKDYNNGILKLGAGIHVLPYGEFNFTQSFQHFVMNAKVFGKNTKSYIDNAGYNISGAELNTDIYISNQSNAFPGLNISLDGNIFRDKYKFYGSTNPNLERETTNGFGSLSFINYYNREVSYGLTFDGSYLNINENGFDELNYGVKGFWQSKFNYFGFRVNAEFQQQSLQNNLSVNADNKYYGINSAIKLSPSKILTLELGLSMAKQDSNSFITPFVGANIKLEKGISLFAEYHPQYQFNSIRELININRYMKFGNAENYFVKDNSKFKLAIKYEYLTQFDVSAGFEARTVDNYFYFEDRTSTGFFDTYKEDDVKIVTLFLNSNLLTNRFGNFFADLRIQDARASFNNVIPYEPGVVFTAAYNYNFNFGLNATLRYKFSSESYSDIQNSVKLPYLNSLDLFVKYELFTNFYTFAELNNIINNKNYYWKLYQEKTFDVLLGIEYQF